MNTIDIKARFDFDVLQSRYIAAVDQQPRILEKNPPIRARQWHWPLGPIVPPRQEKIRNMVPDGAVVVDSGFIGP